VNSEPTAADTKKKKENGQADRFRYIGFEVFPQQSGPFFKSEEEKKKHLQEIEAARSPQDIAEREFSHLFGPSFTKMDKGVLYLCALVLIGGLFMPWFFLPKGGGLEMFFGFNLLMVLATRMGAVFQVSWIAGAGAALGVLNLVVAPLLGLRLFWALIRTKSGSEQELNKLKKVLGWHRFPVLLYVLIIGLSIAGFKAPESPLLFFKEGFNIFDLIAEAGVGFWAILMGHLLAAVKTADL
jgi:hypothetical protein